MRPRLVGASLLTSVLAVVGLVVVLTDDRYVADAPPALVERGDPAAASVLLSELASALGEGDDASASALAPSGDTAAGTLLAALAENAGRLDVRDLSLRFVEGEVPGEAGSWTVRADLTWSFGGVDAGVARSEVEVGLRSDGAGWGVTGFVGGRVPLWLRGPVLVDRRPGTLVVTAGRSPAAYAVLAERALPQVRRVLPGVTGDLVVEVPASSAELDTLLGVPEGTYRGVAAVTASVDGLLSQSSPVHVFVNPDELDRLRRTGAQVVMTHEAVHALTGAPTSRAPVWLVEGFADYVALRDVRLPLSRTAAQVIAQVRRDGVPSRLPDETDFDIAAPHLGAAYEAAWLVCRALADAAGERALVAVYRATSAGEDAGAALRRDAGLGIPGLLARWRALLLEAAGR